uniref:vesicle-fusing ATPase n=1 Tax=Aureoumbra lagunensis TaxID=44058 RepID=A0A7S3K4J8_9STRA
MSTNNFIKQGVEVVSEAIAADNAEEYEKALGLYKRALEVFMTGVKYEKNPAARDTILQRVEGYMKRAEDLKGVIEQRRAAGTSSGGRGGAATKDKDKDKESSADEEQQKLRGQLASAIVTEKPNVKWSDVAGLEGAKAALKETIILPQKFPQLFVGKRKPWKGILLYGPPGTGKSFLAKAVATEADAKFFAVSSSDLVSKWQGESERLVKQLFSLARDEEHSIIFIDEVDSLCGSRSEGESDATRRIKTEFLVAMQGVASTNDGLLVLGATNVPWELDPAIRRRFEKRIYIPLPEAAARARMIQLHLGDTPHTLAQQDFEAIADDTEGFSGSDLSIVVREALMEPLRKCQTARQFIPVPGNSNTDDSSAPLLQPCAKYPNCAYCPMQLSSDPPGDDTFPQCSRCKAFRMALYDVPSAQLKVPEISYDDFLHVLAKARKSVAPEELGRFVEWTNNFGAEG